MNKTCILFFHHKNDELTNYHWQLVQEYNQDCDCFAVWCDDGFSNRECLADAVEIPCTFQCGNNAANADLIWRQWFISYGRDMGHCRFIWVEYDTNCQVSLSTWLAEVWHKDVAASQVYGSEWWWHKQIQFLPRSWQSYASGIAPFNMTMLSRAALEAYANEPMHESLFCELRMPTFFKKAGFGLTQFPRMQSRANGYMGDKVVHAEVVGCISHPVKKLCL
jgi:hypothetical protein